MAGYSTGRAGPLSAGSQTINTNLSGTPIGCRITVGGKNSGDTDTHLSVGTYDGTHQNVQYTYGGGSGTNSSDIILIKSNTGTVLLEASATGLGMSGGNGTVTINVATNNTSFSPTVEVWN